MGANDFEQETEATSRCYSSLLNGKNTKSLAEAAMSYASMKETSAQVAELV
jgi:hypothetical protein